MSAAVVAEPEEVKKEEREEQQEEDEGKVNNLKWLTPLTIFSWCLLFLINKYTGIRAFYSVYSSANSVQWDVNALEEFYTLCRKRFGCSLRKGQIAVLKLSFQTVKKIFGLPLIPGCFWLRHWYLSWERGFTGTQRRMVIEV